MKDGDLLVLDLQLKQLEEYGKEMVTEVDKACDVLEEAGKILRLVLWKMEDE